MTTRAWMLALALLLPLAGCGGEETREPETEEAGHGHAETAETGAAAQGPGAERSAQEQEGVLALDPGVLRDLKLTTFPAELRPGGEGVTVLGELRVDESAYAEVGVPIPARVVRLVAAPGEIVRRGEALAELQSVELGRARAERTAARARAELARKTVERKRGLAAERIVSRGDLQRSEAEAAQAEADLQAAEAAVAALGIGTETGTGAGAGAGGGDLSRFSLPSPLAGTVLERTAVRGQMADPSRTLFRVADLSRLWLVVQSPERDATRVRPGSPVEIRPGSSRCGWSSSPTPTTTSRASS